MINIKKEEWSLIHPLLKQITTVYIHYAKDISAGLMSNYTRI